MVMKDIGDNLVTGQSIRITRTVHYGEAEGITGIDRQ
jgi:hypothetical protein